MLRKNGIEDCDSLLEDSQPPLFTDRFVEPNMAAFDKLMASNGTPDEDFCHGIERELSKVLEANIAETKKISDNTGPPTMDEKELVESIKSGKLEIRSRLGVQFAREHSKTQCEQLMRKRNEVNSVRS